MNPITLLIAEDDPEDRLLTKEALEENRLRNKVLFVEDGEELMEYLHGKGKYADRSEYPFPGIILLDLNMPRKDGREALWEIKNDPDLRKIPVIVLTTSRADEDIIRSYELGVNSFISKPVTFDGLTKVMHTLSRYWLEIVLLPGTDH